MVFGIFKHIYKAIQEYYFPQKPQFPRLDLSDLVPLYDTKGVIKAYVAGLVADAHHAIVPPSWSMPIPLRNSGLENVYYIRTVGGEYIPASIQQPTLAQNGTTGIVKREQDPRLNWMEWDGWPDGYFQRDFTFEEVEKTKHIMVHWAFRTNGGDRKGDSHAERWELGKRSTRICLGIIWCDNEHCNIIVRPQTTSIRIAAQLRQPCPQCGARLIRQSCPVQSRLWTWSGGIHYDNGGLHRHPRPTHVLHLSSSEETPSNKLSRIIPKLALSG